MDKETQEMFHDVKKKQPDNWLIKGLPKTTNFIRKVQNGDVLKSFIIQKIQELESEIPI